MTLTYYEVFLSNNNVSLDMVGFIKGNMRGTLVIDAACLNRDLVGIDYVRTVMKPFLIIFPYFPLTFFIFMKYKIIKKLALINLKCKGNPQY